MTDGFEAGGLADSVGRVDVDGVQRGSSFAVGDDSLATADHVIPPEHDEIKITWPSGESDEVELSRREPGPDLAVLKSDGSLERPILELGTSPPEVGTRVVWAGFAQLIGEEGKMGRVRHGWGNVASRPYGDPGSFFEVDGLFNPGHSGGPIVDASDGSLLGVVSASAGNVDDLLSDWRSHGRAATELIELYSNAVGGSGFVSRLQFDNPADALQAKEELEELGVDADMEQSDDGVFSVTFMRSELPAVSMKQLRTVALSLIRTAERTFQMGLGVGSGGEPLENLLPKGGEEPTDAPKHSQKT